VGVALIAPVMELPLSGVRLVYFPFTYLFYGKISNQVLIGTKIARKFFLSVYLHEDNAGY